MSSDLIRLVNDYAAMIDRMNPIIEAALKWRKVYDAESRYNLVQAIDAYERGVKDDK